VQWHERLREPEPIGLMARQGVVPRSCSDLLSPEPETLASTPRRLSSEIKPDNRLLVAAMTESDVIADNPNRHLVSPFE
jgi:hypothetical protein